MDMKAITLRHPWAFAVARLDKRIENRTWKPPPSLIGRRIAIHGGVAPKGEALGECVADIDVISKQILTQELYNALPAEKRHWLIYHAPHTVRDWITPGIVATATLKGVVTTSDSPWFFGPFGWVLEDVEPLETPVPHRGAQGLWPVSEEALKLLTPERS